MPGENDIQLSEKDRQKLDGIVSQMTKNNEPEANIQAVVSDFKTKYGQKKSPSGSLPSESANGASSSEDTSSGYSVGADGLPIIPPTSTAVQPVQNPQAAITPVTQTAEQNTGYTPEELSKSMLFGETNAIMANKQGRAQTTGEKVQSALGQKTEALGRGMAKAASILSKSPAFIYDFFTEPLRNPNSLFPTAIPVEGGDGPFSQDAGLNIPTSSQIGDATGIKNPIAAPLEEAVQGSANAQAQRYDKGITDYLKQGDYAKGFSLLGDQILESLPTTAALAVGIASNPTVANSLAVTSFAADKKDQVDKALPNATEAEKNSIAMMSGSLEMAFENLGLTKLGPIVKNLYQTAGKDAAAQVAKEGFEQSTKKVLLKYLGISGEEMGSEMANQFAQNMITIESGEDPNLNPMDGVIDAGLVALGASGVSTSLPAAYEVARTRKGAQKATALAEQKAALTQDLNDPDVPPETKKIISNKIGDIHQQEAEVAKDEKDKYNNLPDERKQEVDGLLKKAHEISKAATDPNISQQTKELLAKDLDAIDSQVDKVYEESANEKAAADNEELQYLKKLKKSFGLDENEAQRLSELESKSAPIEGESVTAQPAQATPQKPMTEMSSEELYDYAQKQKTDQRSVEDEVFGDKANEYRQAVQAASSTMSKSDEVQSASKKVSEMEASLNEEQKRALFGDGHDPQTVRKLAQQVGLVEEAQNEDDLAAAIKNPLVAFSQNKDNENAVTVLNAAKRKAQELGIDPEKLLNTAAENAASTLKDKQDASFLKDAVVQSVKEGTQASEELPPASQVKPNTENNATEKGNIEQSDLAEHQNGGQSGTTTSSGRSNSNEQSGQVQQGKEEVATNKEQTQQKFESALDEEEDDNVVDSPEAKEKLDKDIEAMKQMSTDDLAEKKFVGMIERAWKAKEDGKISRSTYTDFRNKAKDILQGKVAGKDNVSATEAKLRVAGAINKVKEKLIGQGYNKITLSSIVPITPKNVDDLLTLTGHIITRGINAGMDIADATKKAIDVIKNHPVFKKLVKEGSLDEKAFEKEIKAQFPEKKAAKPQKEADQQSQSQPDEISGEVRKKKTAARLDESKRMKAIAKEVKESDKFYRSISVPKAQKYINETIDKYESENLIVNLAEEMASGGGPFHEKIAQMAAAMLSERLRVIGEKSGSDFTKSTMSKLASRVWANRMQKINVAATITGIESEVAKMLPLSEEGLRDLVNANISQVQDSYLNQSQQKAIQQTVDEILSSEEGQKAVREKATEEVQRIAEAARGKEWVNDVRSKMQKLKIDISNC